jgi:MAF protein
VVDGEVLGKPGSHERAVAQLSRCAGRRVTFLTGLCLLDTRNDTCDRVVEPYHVHFRDLPRARIEAYLRREAPYDSAGSFKSEGLGIALFARLEGDDPNALIGLPLIRLTDMLARAGVEVLA